jgi:hypothetical protein
MNLFFPNYDSIYIAFIAFIALFLINGLKNVLKKMME